MPRTTKVIGFSIPPTMLREVERISRKAGKSKSELFREMFRVYKQYQSLRDETEENLIVRLIAEGKRERQTSPRSTAELVSESRALAARGARQARKMGLKMTEAETAGLIHDHRGRD